MPRFWFSRSFGNNSGGSGATPPAAPTMAVTDFADNSGGLATISGGEAGAINTVYSQRVDGELGGGTWVSRGSRTGDGTVTLTIGGSLTAGYYWWRMQSVTAGGAAESNLVYQPLTDGASAVLYRCLLAAQARIQGLALAGVANASVVIRETPVDRHFNSSDIALPAVLLAPVQSERMDTTAGTNARDDIGYPLGCFLLAADNQALAPAAGRFKCREQIARAFRQQKLPGVSEVWNCEVDSLAIADAAGWQRNLFVSGLLLRFVSREVRGM